MTNNLKQEIKMSLNTEFICGDCLIPLYKCSHRGEYQK